MVTPKSRVKLLEAEGGEVQRYLSSLPLEDLDKDSACEGWTVADVVSHLAGQPFAARITRGLRGDITPDEGASAIREYSEDQFARDIFDRAQSTKEQHGDRLLEVLFERLDEIGEVFNAVCPDQWETLCYWPPGPEPVHTMLDMRLSELTMHAWDIRSVLDDRYHLSDGSVIVLIETVDRAIRRAFRPDQSTGNQIRYRFIMEHPISVDKDIVMAPEGGRVESASAETPDVTFRCDGETYVLIMYGRITIESAIDDARVTFHGDAEFVSDFSQRFVGG